MRKYFAVLLVMMVLLLAACGGEKSVAGAPETQAHTEPATDAVEPETTEAPGLDLEALKAEIVGVWVHEAMGDNNMPEEYKLADGDLPGSILAEANCGNGPYSVEFLEDGTLIMFGQTYGTWELSEDGMSVTMNPLENEYVVLSSAYADVFEEDGFTKLIMHDVTNLVRAEPIDQTFAYVKQEDYRAAFEKKYVHLSLSDETVHDYIADPVMIGTIVDENGEEATAVVYPSVAYDKGLVYLGSRGTMTIECLLDGASASYINSFPVYEWIYTDSVTDLKIAQCFVHEISYVKAEYVVENHINEDGYRELVLTNGVTIVYNNSWSENAETAKTFWTRVDVDYNDYIY